MATFGTVNPPKDDHFAITKPRRQCMEEAKIRTRDFGTGLMAYEGIILTLIWHILLEIVSGRVLP